MPQSNTIRSRLPIDAVDVLIWGSLLTAELLLLMGYQLATRSTVTEPRYVVYPFVWINLGLFAMYRTRVRLPSRRSDLVALALASVYLFVLFSLGGLLQLGLFQSLGPGSGTSISWTRPGWGPMVAVQTEWIQVVLIPFKAIGYVSFAYLLYARLVDATASAVSGVFGVVSCVGCTFPILLPLLGASTFSAVSWLSVDLSTLVFVLTLALLYWGNAVARQLSVVTLPIPFRS